MHLVVLLVLLEVLGSKTGNGFGHGRRVVGSSSLIVRRSWLSFEEGSLDSFEGEELVASVANGKGGIAFKHSEQHIWLPRLRMQQQLLD